MADNSFNFNVKIHNRITDERSMIRIPFNGSSFDEVVRHVLRIVKFHIYLQTIGSSVSDFEPFSVSFTVEA